MNAALAQQLQDLPSVQVRYVYELYPDGKIDIVAEQAVLSQAQRIVLQFPMYWYNCPPLLKQWLDEVFTYGWAYGSTGKALAGKELLLAVSLGAPQANYQPQGVMGRTAEEYLYPFEGTARFTQMRYLPPFLTFGALSISEEGLAQAAAAYRKRLEA